MMANKPKLTALQVRIRDLLRTSPQGLTVQDIRRELNLAGTQEQLGRRIRTLRPYFDIPLKRVGGEQRYFFNGERDIPYVDDGAISGALRARLLNRANGRCQMCGKTISEDGIKLQIDHKIPRNWGGATEENNLWALCQPCNGGKRDYFASFDDDTMARVLGFDSVYERIGELLKLKQGDPVESRLLEFVANFNDWQDDWPKRLRELRYPVIGWKIQNKTAKAESGRKESYYILLEWSELPDNHRALIKEYERMKRRQRN
ncbi:HNH endonuclease signature motif containing protein [Maricaulis maris]|uniref:HNH endonuclease n=1 Tax=Maricaulis maris TaxID=74318 RepID=UPI0026EB9C98|nr:HNH endonuclease signature motif containing protein [Maricaulis maris]